MLQSAIIEKLLLSETRTKFNKSASGRAILDAHVPFRTLKLGNIGLRQHLNGRLVMLTRVWISIQLRAWSTLLNLCPLHWYRKVVLVFFSGHLLNQFVSSVIRNEPYLGAFGCVAHSRLFVAIKSGHSNFGLLHGFGQNNFITARSFPFQLDQ